MIDLSVLLAFLATSAVVILVPGSDVFLLLRLSLSKGVGAGMKALAGIHLGNAVQATLMISGVGLIISQIPFAIMVLKILGAAYLIYLAAMSLLAVLRKPKDAQAGTEEPQPKPARAAKDPSPFAQGLLTNITNPKVLLFFIAFFPQFLGNASNVSLQLLLLSAVFIGLAIVWEAVIVLAAARLGATMKSPNFSKIMDTICAVAFTGLAALILMPAA
jgi:threonine/homoserine/homoserine lactone efflux protein